MRRNEPGDENYEEQQVQDGAFYLFIYCLPKMEQQTENRGQNLKDAESGGMVFKEVTWRWGGGVMQA